MRIIVKQTLADAFKRSGFTTWQEAIRHGTLSGEDISRATIHNILADKNLANLRISTVNTLCMILNCKFEDIIQIEYQWDEPQE